jgi:hypothetical protein
MGSPKHCHAALITLPYLSMGIRGIGIDQKFRRAGFGPQERTQST